MITIKTKMLALLSLLGLLLFAPASQAEEYCCKVMFKQDGTRLYKFDETSPAILGYSLRDSWDMATAMSPDVLDISNETSTPEYFYIMSDGTLILVTEKVSTQVFEYGFLTPWELSSASFTRIHEAQ